MTLSEAIVSALILAMSTRVSLQGWNHISSTARDLALRREQLQQLELLLLSGRRQLQARASLATPALLRGDGSCRFLDPAAIRLLQASLPADPDVSVRIHSDPDAQGLLLLAQHQKQSTLKRQLLLTPAGLGLCSRGIQP